MWQAADFVHSETGLDMAPHVANDTFDDWRVMLNVSGLRPGAFLREYYPRVRDEDLAQLFNILVGISITIQI